MNLQIDTNAELNGAKSSAASTGREFGCARDFFENRFVYCLISPRARGLSVGVNMNPDQRCNFDCAYCEVNRNEPPRESRLEPSVGG